MFDTHLVLLYMLLYTLEVIPIILTGGQGKPLLDPQLSSKHSQDIPLFKKALEKTLMHCMMQLKKKLSYLNILL